MTAARILERVQFGYGKAGSKLGFAHAIYRPLGPLVPALDPMAWISDRPFAVSETADAAFKRPAKYGEAVAFALVDVRGGAVCQGDYVVGPTGTWFVASVDQLVAPMVVRCTHQVTISRPAGNTSSGVQPYGGRRSSTDVPKLAQWPASILAGGRTEASRADLPSDTPRKGYQVLLPMAGDLVLEVGDRLSDDQGRVMMLDQAELSPLGWRLLASLVAS